MSELCVKYEILTEIRENNCAIHINKNFAGSYIGEIVLN